MEFHIVWPNCWWNIAFAVACVIFVLVLISNKIKENDKSNTKVSKVVLNILLNGYLWGVLCLLSFLAGFILTIYLLHNGITKEVNRCYDTGMVLSVYTVLGIVIPAIIACFCADANKKGIIFAGFVFAAGNSFVGLIFLLCDVFTYMWVALVFFIFDILGAVVASFMDD